MIAPFRSGGAAPWRGASVGRAGVLLSAVGAAGWVAAIFGPGAVSAWAVVGFAKVGILATAVRATAMLLGAAGLAAPGAVALGAKVRAGWAAAFAIETVGAGGAATGATGAAAIWLGATRKAERITGCEPTKALVGTTVAKRWFINAVRWPASKASRPCARSQRSRRISS